MPSRAAEAAITESPATILSRAMADTKRHFLGLNPKAGAARAMRATANLLSIKCIQQRNSG